MSGDFPLYCWQYECRKKWNNFSHTDNEHLNKAVAKRQKYITLSTNPKKTVEINLEKMIQRNPVTGYEQRIRCSVYNDKFYAWFFQDNFGDFISFTPHVTLYLEITYNKRLQKVKYIDSKVEFEVDFLRMEQVNTKDNSSCAVSREEVDFVLPNLNMLDFIQLQMESENLIEKLSEKSEESLKNILFGLPTTTISVATEILPDPSYHQGIVEALRSEVQASTSSTSELSVSVDPECPDAADTYVYHENSVVYHAPLNLSDLKRNNNKYFIIQLLKYVDEEKYAVWFHWGRVGYKGQNSLINCGTNLKDAKETFEKKFYDKTRNHWSEKSNFQTVPGKYDLLQTDFSEQVSAPVPVAESKLESSIQDLLKIICNKKTLEEAAKEMDFDSSVTPLGKITARQILEGYDVINEITDVLKNEGIGTHLVECCNKFYTKIPHNFGKKTPPLITSMEAVKEKLKMLEDLSNICLALDVLNSSSLSENPLDKYYKTLECDLIPVAYDSEEFKSKYVKVYLETLTGLHRKITPIFFKAKEHYGFLPELSLCLSETHGPTHNTYSMQLITAFKCLKEEENACFRKYGNNKLLWHGSRLTNWIGILTRGLQIAPKEAPSTGYMFGKGIYFADVCSKSANYCFPSKRNREGLLLLCEVSLGNTMLTYEAQDCSRILGDCHSVYAVGKHQPNFKNTVLSSEAVLPCGPLHENESEDLTLKYNEYVVYDKQQVKMKYLLRIRFDLCLLNINPN